MERKIQATIGLILAVFFISMPLSMPTVNADWSNCQQYQDRYEKYDAYAYKYLIKQNYAERYAQKYIQKQIDRPYKAEYYQYYVDWYTESAEGFARRVEYYGAKSLTYHHKFYECTEDMGTPEELLTTKYTKYGEWTCYSVDNKTTNHCLKTREGIVGFRLNSTGRLVKIAPSIEYQLWTNGYFPYEASSKYRTQRLFIGQDLSNNCIVAFDLKASYYNDYNMKQFCGDQKAKEVAQYTVAIASAGAIAVVTTSTIMSLTTA